MKNVKRTAGFVILPAAVALICVLFSNGYSIAQPAPAPAPATPAPATTPAGDPGALAANQATLTLATAVVIDNTTKAVAPTAWTLSASPAGQTTVTVIKGVTGSANTTKVRVQAGDFDLKANGPWGFEVAWDCTEGTLNNSTVTVEAGKNAVCMATADDTGTTTAASSTNNVSLSYVSSLIEAGKQQGMTSAQIRTMVKTTLVQKQAEGWTSSLDADIAAANMELQAQEQGRVAQAAATRQAAIDLARLAAVLLNDPGTQQQNQEMTASRTALANVASFIR